MEVVKDWDRSRTFKQCKENAAEGEAVVVGDFSENFVCPTGRGAELSLGRSTMHCPPFCSILAREW